VALQSTLFLLFLAVGFAVAVAVSLRLMVSIFLIKLSLPVEKIDRPFVIYIEISRVNANN
jgi:hypothetical protein